MSSPPLWLALQPRSHFTQVLASQSGTGTVLKARLSPEPMHPGALAMFLQSLAAWQGRELFAVLDADAEEVRRAPERWSRMLGEAAEVPSITVEWSVPAEGRLGRQRFFDMGDFGAAQRVLIRSATGQR